MFRIGQYKRKLKIGERWYSKGQHLNTPYCSRAIYLTKKQAEKWERDKKDEIEEQIRNPRPDISLKEMCEARLNYLKLDKNIDYYEDNRRHAKFILNEWGNVSASEITKKMVNELLLEELKRVKDNGFTNHRVNALLTNIRAFFNYGIKNLDLDIKNPCQGIEKFSVDKKLKFIPGEKLVRDVLKTCNEEQKKLINFVDKTACRIGEALRLTSDDILQNGIVLYTRKSRHSDLVPRVVPHVPLPEYEEGKIFKTWTERPRFLEEKIKELKQPKWNWHNLRHRRASIWANDGMPTIQIMDRLGHSSINTTMIYLRSLGIERA